MTTVQGVDVPALGYGTFQLSGSECERGVAHALSVGYRHLDTAQAYANEDHVGAAIAASGVPREEIFLTTKLWTSELAADRVGPATAASLRRLGTDQVDLLLIHWPSPEVPLGETLAAMVEVMDAGLTRSLGLSNFPPSLVREALGHAPILCNQVEYHPFLGAAAGARGRARLLAHRVLAARPRPGGPRRHPARNRRRARRDARAGRAAMARRSRPRPAIPKATSPERIEENIGAVLLRLDDQERRRIDALERGERLIDPSFAPDWED